MSENIDIYSELDRYVEENMGEVSKTDIATHFFALGQKDAINKACEWLKEEYPKAAAYYEHPDSFIDQFRKAMKGE